MKHLAVKIKNVSKKYTLRHEKPTLIENILKRSRQEKFWALKDINLKIDKGDTVGIIGPNGSGKTTLLEIISGITTPTEGKVTIKGKVVSLIDLGAGFHPELTGEENIYLNGLLIGMSKPEIKDRFKKIISFTNIGQFVDAPLYTYSSGMRLRLGFSIAIHSRPDTLVLDENIAVGDKEFKQKAYDKILNFISNGKTLIVATHSLEFLKSTCKRSVWLEKGRIKVNDTSHNTIRIFEKEYS